MVSPFLMAAIQPWRFVFCHRGIGLFWLTWELFLFGFFKEACREKDFSPLLKLLLRKFEFDFRVQHLD